MGSGTVGAVCPAPTVVVGWYYQAKPGDPLGVADDGALLGPTGPFLSIAVGPCVVAGGLLDGGLVSFSSFLSQRVHPALGVAGMG